MTFDLTAEVGPKYQRLKSYVITQIDQNNWLALHQLPSEHELVRQLDVSRMTVNRALRELANEGYLTRVPGVGTFVAERKSRSHLLEIHNIADEVRNRNHDYSSRVIVNRQDTLNNEHATRIQLPTGSTAFHSMIVHLENTVPIQLEDRYVNPVLVPDYGNVDFSTTTPAEYLLEAVPLHEVEHTVQARMPSRQVRKLLELDETEPCLVLLRRTWNEGEIVSIATLYHPGSRYELNDRFSPKATS